MHIKKPLQFQELQRLLAESRYLLCVDLEATCDDYPKGYTEAQRLEHKLLVQRHEMETIEIGAVVLDLQDGGGVVGEFGRFVRPVLKPELTPFCKGLTSITQEDIDTAATYSEVGSALESFLAPFKREGLMWCSWGDYDAKQLEADATRNSCPAMLAEVAHTNAKKWHWKILACRAMGLKKAVEHAGLTWSGTHHRGIDDARNLGVLVAHLLRHRHQSKPLKDVDM